MCHLGEGVFCDVLVGDVSGLDQLAGDLGVCRVRGLPTGACKTSKEDLFSVTENVNMAKEQRQEEAGIQ